MSTLKILIFGGSGFLGQHLIKKLYGQHDIVVVNHISNFSIGNTKNCHIINGDILKPQTYESILDSVDVVINLVGQMEPNLENLVKTNISGSLNLLNSIIKNKVKKIILISTINVYGENMNFPSKEEDELFPLTNYGQIKMITEKLYQNFSELHDLDVTILRLSGVFGPGKIKGFFPQMINSLKTGQILTPYNFGNQLRDFIFIDDAIDGIISSLNYDFNGTSIFNISTGKRNSIKEVINLAEKISNTKINIKYNSEKYDEESIWANNSKAKKLLNFEPKISLEEGIKNTLNFENS